MDNELKQQIQEGNKERKRYLRMIRIGTMMMNFGKRWMGREDGETRYSSLFARIALVVILFGTGLGIVPIVTIYIVLHLGIYFVGNQIFDVFTDKLRAFEGTWKDKYHRYFAEKAFDSNIKFDVDGNYVEYMEEGLLIDERGMVYATLKEPITDIYLYILKNNGDFKSFSDLKFNAKEDTVVMNDKIASVDFNQKFGVITDKEYELESMKYLSPSRQLKMVKTPALEKFYNIHIGDYSFRARTDNHVEMPGGINAYEKKNLMKYFEEAEQYCLDMKAMADKVHADYLEIAFLLEK